MVSQKFQFKENDQFSLVKVEGKTGLILASSDDLTADGYDIKPVISASDIELFADTDEPMDIGATVNGDAIYGYELKFGVIQDPTSKEYRLVDEGTGFIETIPSK